MAIPVAHATQSTAMGVVMFQTTLMSTSEADHVNAQKFASFTTISLKLVLEGQDVHVRTLVFRIET